MSRCPSIHPSVCKRALFKNIWATGAFCYILQKLRVVPYISKNVAQVSGLIYGPIVFILYAIFKLKIIHLRSGKALFCYKIVYFLASSFYVYARGIGRNIKAERF